ncbi:hypothetical protein SAMN05421819_3533 [Bryocella elongata]|uniref:Uncharacterized protein n=1 Tax=Bryocella elongata TaxID=863522 RepID=A0A1H6B5M9_9BACT|nr:hypothetical protein [Bryocella elongata]SEG55930.1 hypothetical protein SAMN05421819_3533 [Bryocella elongata]
MAERLIEYAPKFIAFSTPMGPEPSRVREMFLRTHEQAAAELVAERAWLRDVSQERTQQCKSE